MHDEKFIMYNVFSRFINSHNRAGKSFQLGVNHLADKDDVEIRALRGNRYTPGVEKHGDSFPYPIERIHEMKKDLPESLDWRLNGAVTPVKGKKSVYYYYYCFSITIKYTIVKFLFKQINRFVVLAGLLVLPVPSREHIS